MLANMGSPRVNTSRSLRRGRGQLTRDAAIVLPVPQAREVLVEADEEVRC
jgi:hypothetical protein